MKQKFQRYLSIWILLSVILISAFIISRCDFNKDEESQIAVDLFFEALIEGDADKLNEQFVSRYFESSGSKEGYTDFSPQKITNIRVEPLDKSTPEEIDYEVVFDIADNTAPPFIIAGSGELTYYFTVVMEEDAWKIKMIATSP